MANELLVKQGTSITWTSAGGDEVLTLTSLANGDGRQGEGCGGCSEAGGGMMNG